MSDNKQHMASLNPNTSGNNARQKAQSGFSLVEMMISMALGLFLTLAAIELFSVSQRNFNIQQGLTQVLDDGQLVMRFMTDDVRRAGVSGGALPLDDAFLFAGANGSADGVPNDQLAFQFSGTRDCEGSTSATPVIITNIYNVNAAGQLVCQGSLSAGTGIPLVEGVSGLRVRYGLDMDNDGEVGPLVFMGADDAETEDRPIMMVQIALLLGRDNPALQPANARAWRLYDRMVETPSDTITRRIFYSSIMLRNIDREQL